MERWYLLQCKSRQEGRAAQQLENQHLDTFLPLLQCERLRGGRRIAVREPLFPGYLFVRFDPEFFSLTTLQSTRGVARLVRYGTSLASMPDEIIQLIRERCDSGSPDYAIGGDNLAPEAGDAVMVTKGPFAGLDAIFVEADGVKRAVLMIEILGNAQQLVVGNDEYQSRSEATKRSAKKG